MTRRNKGGRGRGGHAQTQPKEQPAETQPVETQPAPTAEVEAAPAPPAPTTLPTATTPAIETPPTPPQTSPASAASEPEEVIVNVPEGLTQSTVTIDEETVLVAPETVAEEEVEDATPPPPAPKPEAALAEPEGRMTPPVVAVVGMGAPSASGADLTCCPPANSPSPAPPAALRCVVSPGSDAPMQATLPEARSIEAPVPVVTAVAPSVVPVVVKEEEAASSTAKPAVSLRPRPAVIPTRAGAGGGAGGARGARPSFAVGPSIGVAGLVGAYVISRIARSTREGVVEEVCATVALFFFPVVLGGNFRPTFA